MPGTRRSSPCRIKDRSPSHHRPPDFSSQIKDHYQGLDPGPSALLDGCHDHFRTNRVGKNIRVARPCQACYVHFQDKLDHFLDMVATAEIGLRGVHSGRKMGGKPSLEPQPQPLPLILALLQKSKINFSSFRSGPERPAPSLSRPFSFCIVDTASHSLLDWSVRFQDTFDHFLDMPPLPRNRPARSSAGQILISIKNCND